MFSFKIVAESESLKGNPSKPSNTLLSCTSKLSVSLMEGWRKFKSCPFYLLKMDIIQVKSKPLPFILKYIHFLRMPRLVSTV